jgi:hypothetical protein
MTPEEMRNQAQQCEQIAQQVGECEGNLRAAGAEMVPQWRRGPNAVDLTSKGPSAAA